MFERLFMKKKLIKILNRYSLLYLPLMWVIGLAIFFITFEPSSILYFLSFFVIGIFYLLIVYSSKRKLVDVNFDIKDHKFTIIEFYSDYWLGCAASKFIVDEFKKKYPEVYFVSVNASKQKEHEFIKIYKLFTTPTYVLINDKGEKLAKSKGTFNSNLFIKSLN